MATSSGKSGARDPADVRRRMRRIRRQLPTDVDRIVDGARQLVDWKHYVQQYPWASAALAAAIGYLVVPRRPQVISPDAAVIEKLAKRQRLMIEPASAAKIKPGLLDSMLGVAGNMLFRAGVAYAGQQLGKVVGQQSVAAGEPIGRSEP